VRGRINKCVTNHKLRVIAMTMMNGGIASQLSYGLPRSRWVLLRHLQALCS
jgi:hypothetical protein